jgi:hypothetical protein
MGTIPIQFDMAALEEMVETKARELASTLKCLVLFVDGEYYGAIDFPVSAELCINDVWTFPGYGRIQIVAVQEDQIHCTQNVNEETARAQPVPARPKVPLPDVRKLLRPGPVSRGCNLRR